MTIGDASAILGDCHIGDSISVNGCCLTVTEFDANSFKVGLAPETLSRTNLGKHLAFGANVDKTHKNGLRTAESGRSSESRACCGRPHPIRWSFRPGVVHNALPP